MVVLHCLRSLRSYLRGVRCPEVGVFDETSVNLYAGWRMIDAFGHVNNAKYLELFEFGRWHQGGAQRSVKTFKKAQLYPVVAAVHIQYMSEIKAMTTVQVKSKIVNADDRSFVMRQHMLSQDGTKLFSTAFFRLSIVSTRPDSKGVLAADEAIRRLGFDPVVVRAELAKAWDSEVDLSSSPSSAGSQQGATTGDTLAAEEAKALPSHVMSDVNELDRDWRGMLRSYGKRLKADRGKR